MFTNLIFYIGLSGLLVHELDAVHKREWRLLFVLRKMNDERAHLWFVVLHIPLLIILFWLITNPNASIKFWSMICMDVFLIIHAGLHWRLSDHPKNDFNTPLSKALIYGSAVFGAIHIALS